MSNQSLAWFLFAAMAGIAIFFGIRYQQNCEATQDQFIFKDPAEEMMGDDYPHPPPTCAWWKG